FLTLTSRTPLNACGKVGAALSALLFHSVGLGAFLFPAALFFLSIAVHSREGLIRFLGIFSGMTASVMGLTVFMSLQWKSLTYAGSQILTGGVFGDAIAQLLSQGLNPIGASLVSALLFLVAL